MNARESELTVERLAELYTHKKLSTWRIAEVTNRSRSHIRTLLSRHNIPIRTRAEAHRQYKRKSFNGTSEEKAYLLGFAIGDLRVRKQYEESETIGIACSSTHPAQISLINNLFSPYGRVWTGKPNVNSVVSCEAYVDTSFSFLLKLERDISWVYDAESSFYSFLAGFTDAEGSIYFTSQDKVMLSWGQYDHDLLESIRFSLSRFGYRTGNVISDNLAGYRGKDGYSRKKDYYHLACGARQSLQNLLVALKPYIRHDEKKAKLKEALKRLKKQLDK